MKKNTLTLILTLLISANLYAQEGYKEIATKIFRSVNLTIKKGNNLADYNIDCPFFNLQFKIYNDSFFLGKMKTVYSNRAQQFNGKIIQEGNAVFESKDSETGCFGVKRSGNNNFIVWFKHCDDNNLSVWCIIRNDSLKEFHQFSNSDFNSVAIFYKDTSSLHQMNTDGFDKTYYFNRMKQLIYSWEFIAVPYFDANRNTLLSRYYDIQRDSSGKIMEIKQTKEIETDEYFGTKKMVMKKFPLDGEQFKVDAADKTKFQLEFWKEDKKLK